MASRIERFWVVPSVYLDFKKELEKAGMTIDTLHRGVLDYVSVLVADDQELSRVFAIYRQCMAIRN